MKRKFTYPLPVILIGLLVAAGAALAQGSGLQVPWYTVDGGGGISAGGDYTVHGTIGQPDAGPPLSGNGFSLSGGFWHERAAEQGSNNAPAAVDDAFTTTVEEAMTFNVVANDSDPDGNPLSVSAVTQGAHGAVTYSGGSVTYTPDAGFLGDDSFTYTVSDGQGGSDEGAVSVRVVEGDSATIVEPDEDTTITIDHTLSRSVYSTTIEIPAGAASESISLVFDEQAGSARNPTPGFFFVDLFFTLDAYDGTDQVPNLTFAPPITLTFHYNPRYARRGLVLTFWDEEDGWSEDGITVVEHDRTNHKMVVTLNHLSEFVLMAEGYKVHVPIVVNNGTYAPDLVVQSITATSDDVQVVVANQGNAPVTDEFWVIAYINPDPAPTAVNQLWWDLGSEGMFWGVTADLLPLNPGETITLAYNDTAYIADYSRVSWPLAAGTPVYVQVDAYNADTAYGAILESHEINGGEYNNVEGTESVN
jgi:hypothetical protein